MFIQKDETVVRGEDYSKTKHKERSFTQQPFPYADLSSLVCLYHWT